MDVQDCHPDPDPINEEEIEQAIMNNDMTKALEFIQNKLDQANNAPLNIAITGNSGSGKSTFVNAFRGLGNEAKESAPTGVVETTMEATPYAHPKYPNVQLWDLPGIGTPNFQPSKYLEQVGFNKYDFFIIVSFQRFTCNDLNLALEIRRVGKKFYFVRSQIDSTLYNEQKSKVNFNMEATLKKIRTDCIKALTQLGEHQGAILEPPKVFLISSFELQKYDFPSLQNTLESELPEHKRHVLLLAIPNISWEVIQKKKKALQPQVKYYALLSAAVAAVPRPGLSFTTDIGILINAITWFCSGLGLDENTLQSLSNNTGVEIEELKNEFCSPETPFNEINKELILQLLSMSSAVVAMTAAEEGIRFTPFVGSVIASSLSFISTYKMLNVTLDLLAEGAHKVMVKALKLSTGV